jgi:hypothetical protein
MMMDKNSTPTEKKDNVFYNLLFNIIIPVVILSKFSGDNKLGPVYGLIVALAFPLAYGLYDLLKLKKKNFISIIGFVSILFTGIIGLLKFPPEYIAIKEASVPLIIGLAILITIFTPFPLVKKIIYNKEVLDIENIDRLLEQKNAKFQFETILRKASVLLSLSFFLSSFLNYILAKIIVKSVPGTEVFNKELGRMALLSFPVIAVPSLIIMMLIFWYLFHSIKKLTGLSTQAVLNEKLRG